MVRLMQDDGSLTPSHPQKHFSRTYIDGVGQAPMRRSVQVAEEDAEHAQARRTATAPGSTLGVQPHILAAITETGQRYAGHSGLRAAGITVMEWVRLYRANIEIESAYDPQARSQAGAIGLGQLMPETARHLGVDPHDWRENLDGSARYLAMMLAEFGDVRLALAAYNAGPEAIYRHSGIPPFRETQNHVQRVLAVAHRLEGVMP